MIPTIGQRGKVLGATMLVVIECPCGSSVPICLVQAQKAICEACGRVHQMHRCAWDEADTLPVVDISSTPSRAEMLGRN